MKVSKYLFVLTLPISVYVSFVSKGWLTFLPLILYFYVIPFIELFFKPNSENFSKENATIEKNNKWYTYILYFIFIIHISFVLLFLKMMSLSEPTLLETTGRIVSLGIMCGVTGINVAHELGHRNNKFDTILAEILLLTSLNTHFLPYHNGGHHLHVATPNDAATARKNENLYFFWIRSHFTSYQQAWIIENKRLNGKWFSLKNKMIVYSIANILILTLIYFVYGEIILLYFILSAVIGIILLECVNYIEHYGLVRKKNNSNRFEKVKRIHSWNSNHIFGRLALFNLSRHSDHHYNGSKPYQVLNSMPESPQMPTGYPGMILLATIPPLWFWIINKRIEKIDYF